MLVFMKVCIVVIFVLVLQVCVVYVELVFNLLVELCWVQFSVSVVVLVGLCDGGVVVGIGGFIGICLGGRMFSIMQSVDVVELLLLCVVVMNGKFVSVIMIEQQLIEWLDYGVELLFGSCGGSGGYLIFFVKVYVVLCSGVIECSCGFVVMLCWFGGKQCVQVELKVYYLQDGQDSVGGQVQVYSIVVVIMGDWIIVVCLGGNLCFVECGVVSSCDVELQMS